jgi:hypothetical protein
MGEPVTTGMMIGAALGGGTSAIRGGNPLQGALLGGLTGAAGGAFTGGAMGAANPTIGSFAPNFMSTGAVTQTAGAAPTFMQQLGGGVTGIKDAFGGINKYMNQNPVTSQIGMQVAKSAFEPEQQMPYAPAGQVSRGQSAPPMDYMSLLNPQNQTVIRPPQISLLG